MSPGSKVKTEYMKSYREPRWEEHGRYYRELLHYRWGRRLLEQAHVPWLWDDGGPAGASDHWASSESSGAGAPAPQGSPALPPPSEEPAARDETGPQVRGSPEEERAEAGHAKAADAPLPALPANDVEEKPEQLRKETDKLPTSVKPRQRRSALFARGNRKAVKSPQSSSIKVKEEKCPFALYGCGEKQLVTGSQKTHNVCASAPEHEIHESALRAKNRRQVAKRKFAAQS
ncbi:centriole, cilia and spindle-associated protein [Lemur catta]|uniref:centriole, cilia and spindle-associated protein n=1 Tax=Lemur catta TaxID=9447 RepID=UPI001E26947E|nr:centriole, cilia and spindle-associated protein [Lemur catta]